MAASAYYAKKIITNHFMNKGSIKLLDHYYTPCPVSSMINAFHELQDSSLSMNLENISKLSLSKHDLKDLVFICDNNIKHHEEVELASHSNNSLIEAELIDMIKSGKNDEINQLYSWIQQQWDVLSDNIKKQQINIDICKEYQKYTGITDTSLVTPEGQEIIECRDNSVLLPLHNLFPLEIVNKLNIGMVVSFDKHSYFC